jgi:cellulase (glycosyl hydrolase family 5)
VFLQRLMVLGSTLFLLGTPVAHSQFVHTQATEIVDGSGKPLVVRGISIGNWFVLEGYFWRFGGLTQAQTELELVFADLLGPTHAQEFLYNWRQNFMSEADVHRIRQDGFNTIRIPLHTKYLKTDDDEGFKLIDQLLKWCRQEHIYVILMLESGVGGFTGEASDDGPGYPWLLKDTGMQTQVADAWQRVASHYKDDPTILGYDLLNEPLLWSGYLDMEPLIEPEYRRLTGAIRKVDKHHMIILQPPLGRFSAFGQPFDNNTVYSFHSYSATPGPEFLKQYLDFRAKHQVPIFFSEIYAERPPEWLSAHVNLAEKYNIGWMIWPYKKMEGDSTGPYTFPSPSDWPKIITFAHQPRDDRAVRDRNALRPPQKDTDAMFAEILENEKNEHLTVHPEFLNLPGISAH